LENYCLDIPQNLTIPKSKIAFLGTSGRCICGDISRCVSTAKKLGSPPEDTRKSNKTTPQTTESPRGDWEKLPLESGGAKRKMGREPRKDKK